MAPRRELTQRRGGKHLNAASGPSPCRDSMAQVQFFRRRLMQAPTVCMQCDLPEERCTRERYCTICKGQHNVRLCMDGLYYCPDCREACDVSLVSSRGH